MDVDEQIRENLNRVRQAARRYARGDLRYDDAYADGLVGLWKAIQGYDETKGPFSAYAWRRIVGEILDGYQRSEWFCYQRRHGNNVARVDIAVLSNVLVEPHDGFSEWWAAVDRGERAQIDAQRLARIQASIDAELPRNRQVIRAYLAGQSFAEIGEDFGFTESRANQIFRRWLKRLNPNVPVKALGYNGRKKAA